MSGARFRYCFIVTYGRSGSTLLQGILNSIDGFLIRGENVGVLNGLFDLVTAIESSKDHAEGRTSPSPPWYGFEGVDRTKLIDDLRHLFVENFIRPDERDVCIGCKEIRWDWDGARGLDNLLDFVEEVFPNSCFIFNTRNLADVGDSAWWQHEEQAIERLQAIEDNMRAVYGRGRENYFWIRYDDYVADSEALRPLFDFLGAEFWHDVVESVLTQVHSTRTVRPREYWPFIASRDKSSDAGRIAELLDRHDRTGFAFSLHNGQKIEGGSTYGDTR